MRSLSPKSRRRRGGDVLLQGDRSSACDPAHRGSSWRGADTPFVPRARRRTFTNADKRRILQAADLCTLPGGVGALMRREGVYSSSLSTWRRQREAADLAALAPQKRGPKVDAGARIDALQIAQLTRERDKLRVELNKAQLVIEVQKKVTALLDLLAVTDKRGNT